jgi:succinyl-diaminopimelate desuccinylase
MTPVNDFLRVSKRIEQFRDEMVDLQVRLCALPAIAPSSGGEGESRKAEFLASFLRDNGFEGLTLIKAPDLDAPDGFRPNLLAVYKAPERRPDNLGHDPPGCRRPASSPCGAATPSRPGWKRGASTAAASRTTSRIWSPPSSPSRPSGRRPSARVRRRRRPGRGRGNGQPQGHQYVIEHDNPFRKQDLIIVPDAGNEKGTLIEVAEKSLLWLKIKTVGRQTHAANPEKGVNAFKAASFLITELETLHRRFPARDRLFDPPLSTFEPTKKESNVPNINTIPGEDVFYLDTYPPGLRRGDGGEEDRALADRIEARFGVRVEIEVKQKAPAARRPSARACRPGSSSGPSRRSTRRKPRGDRRRHRGGPVPAFRKFPRLLVEDRGHGPPAQRILRHRDMVGDPDAHGWASGPTFSAGR